MGLALFALITDARDLVDDDEAVDADEDIDVYEDTDEIDADVDVVGADDGVENWPPVDICLDAERAEVKPGGGPVANAAAYLLVPRFGRVAA